MSVRSQERREKRAMRRADQAEREIVARQRKADKKADNVINRIERGDSRLNPGESFDDPSQNAPSGAPTEKQDSETREGS